MALPFVSGLFMICVALLHVVSPAYDPSITDRIDQTYNLACLLSLNSTVLLTTYLSHQGSPFNSRGFSIPGIRYERVPTASISFLKWKNLSDVERLGKNYEAYTTFFEFLQLVQDDQVDISPNAGELVEMLRVTQWRIQGLLSNLTSLLSAMGFPPAPGADQLMLDAAEVNTFEKKVRGYLVCHAYKEWIDRTVRDFALLKKKFPS